MKPIVLNSPMAWVMRDLTVELSQAFSYSRDSNLKSGASPTASWNVGISGGRNGTAHTRENEHM